MAEGVVVVPLYSRQATAELVHMMHDCAAAADFLHERGGGGGNQEALARRSAYFVDRYFFVDEAGAQSPPIHHEDGRPDHDYLHFRNVGRAERRDAECRERDVHAGGTNARLDQLMGPQKRAGESFSLFAVFVCGVVDCDALALSRNSALSLSTDLTKLADELKIASPNYFLNVPTLLERVRRTIQETIQKRGTFAATVFSKAQDAYGRRSSSQGSFADTFWLALANRFMFPTIRAGIGPNLKGIDLRFGAALDGDPAIFYDVGNSGSAGLRPDGNYGDLHHGRPASRGSRMRGRGGAGYGNEGRR